MNELYATINFSKQKFILNGVDLISGDYNSTKIKFTFEDNQDKTKVIEIRPATSEDKNPTFMATITNNEVILTSKDEDEHNVTPFTTGGVYYMEISAYSNDSKLSTITKSFNVLEEQIILSDEIVSPYLPVFDELIEEIIRVTDEASNVNIDVTKNNNITTVTITNRDGVVKTVQILDGKDGIDGKDGEDGVGIESIEKISTVGLVDTYRITLTNNEYYDYEITNGNGIVSIEKTGTAGNIDTYTITYSDGTTSTFTVTNSEVTEEEFEELQSQVNELSLYVNALPKVTGTGTEVTLNDTAECPMPMSLKPSATSQATSILPDGYTQVDYIESSGTQYIDTGYVFTTEYGELDIEEQVTEVPATDTPVAIGGLILSGTGRTFLLQQNSTSGIYYQNGISPLNINSNINNNLKHNVKCVVSDKHYLYIDNTLIGNSVKQGTIINSNGLIIFARKSGTSAPTNYVKMRLFKYKLYDNNVLVRNMIPCYRNSDNEVGMYDTVNGVFYKNGNSNTSSFTYGSVVTVPNPDYPIDIHTVSGNNTIEVTDKNLFDLANSSWSGSGASNMIKIENGIKFNSIASSGLQYAYDINKNYLAGTYTYSYIASGTNSRIYIRIRKKDDSGWMTSSDTNIPGMSYVSVYNGWYQYFSTLEVEETFTIPDCLYWNIGLGYNSGVAVPKTITNIQLEKGSQATSYLQYAKYTLPLNLPVENLFDKTNTTILNAYVSDSAISGQDIQARLVIIPVKPNTTYTISKSNRGFDSSHQWMERIAEFSSVPTYSTPFIVRYTNVGMSYTFTTSANTNYIVYDVAYGTSYVSNLQDYIDTIQLEKGTKVNAYTPYGTTPIELCKIGTYEDYFYKESGKWYLKKNVLKTSDVIGSLSKTISDMVSNATVYSYCGGTVSGTTITYSSALTVENEIYYPTTTPTNIEITNTTLIGELEAIYNKATSYQDQTNITQVNNDLPFVITASAIYDLSNLLN